MADPLQPFRDAIDSIDKQIIDLLAERYKNVSEIGNIKRSRHMPIYVPEREKALMAKLLQYNNNRLDDNTVKAIYREIISGAIRTELPLKVTFLGPKGTFSHQAVMQHFGHGIEAIPCNSIIEALHSVEKGLSDFACVPVENAIEGVVNQTLDTLRELDLQITAEFKIRISHYLLSNFAIDRIKVVYSHPQILGQCRKFLAEKLPNTLTLECPSSVSAIEAAIASPDSAAIAGNAAIEMSGLRVIAEHIEDHPRNMTRFLIVGKQSPAVTGDDKCSICFVLQDRSGALFDVLKPLQTRNISMSMIESRPFSTTGQYCFFVDIEGHEQDEAVAEALAEIKNASSFFKILGSYPQKR
ncbi:MAG: prephenate dehydratase [Lentisphaeria bacterium]|nr:prephenate dehydratase [Lentisphaeria bacterium]